MEEIKKLRRKFLFVNMLIVTLVVICAFVAIGTTMKRRLEMEVIDSLHRVITQDNPDETLIPKDDRDLRLPYLVLSVNNNSKDIEVTSGKFYSLSDANELQEIVKEVSESDRDIGLLQSVNMRYLRIHTPDAIRIACIDYSFEKHVLDNTVITLCFIGSAVWIAFFILCIFLSYWIVKPVELSWRQQRQFIADASHELKTPVTVIAANAELLETEKNMLSPDGRRWLDHITDESIDMKDLVENLLNIARFDERRRLQKIRFDLSQMIMECVLEFEAIFYQQGKTLNYHITDNILLDGCASQIKQLMKILLDNAVKYSKEQGETVVSLEQDKYGRTLLKVASQGEEIPKESRKAIFQRFYRLNEARDDHKGYGIGLSIAKQIVTEHKGKIYVESLEGWNYFCINFKKQS